MLWILCECRHDHRNRQSRKQHCRIDGNLPESRPSNRQPAANAHHGNACDNASAHEACADFLRAVQCKSPETTMADIFQALLQALLNCSELLLNHQSNLNGHSNNDPPTASRNCGYGREIFTPVCYSGQRLRRTGFWKATVIIDISHCGRFWTKQ